MELEELVQVEEEPEAELELAVLVAVLFVVLAVLVGVAMVVGTAADGAQQLTVPVGAVVGVQVGEVDITVLAMAILMPLATMRLRWSMPLRQ